MEIISKTKRRIYMPVVYEVQAFKEIPVFIHLSSSTSYVELTFFHTKLKIKHSSPRNYLTYALFLTKLGDTYILIHQATGYLHFPSLFLPYLFFTHGEITFLFI